MTQRYWAVIEYLPHQRAAVVNMFGPDGEWSGGGRVEVRSGRRSDLYEAGYRYASQSAVAKGGVLDRYTEGV